LVLYGETQELDDLVVQGAVPERRLQVPLAAGEQARAELPVGCEPDAVAARAEWLRDWIDENELAHAVGEAEAASGRGGLGGKLLERSVVLLDDRANLTARQDVVLAPGLVGVQRHEFGEPNDVRLAARQLRQRGNFRLREALDRDAVDLDRP